MHKLGAILFAIVGVTLIGGIIFLIQSYGGVQSLAKETVAFVQVHQKWLLPIVFMLALGESLAFISLVLPTTVIFVVLGAFLSGAGLTLQQEVTLGIVAGLGGSVGYAVSYWLGQYFRDDISRIPPFSNHPDMVLRGHKFFEKWGTLAVFIGHFFGPVRAVIPVIAGSLAMSQWKFQLANIPSAFLWGFGVLVLPLHGVKWFLH